MQHKTGAKRAIESTGELAALIERIKASSMRTDFVLDALEQALYARQADVGRSP